MSRESSITPPVVIGLMLSLALMLPVNAKIIYVPDDYSEIWEAVFHANPGDTIIVRDGVYSGVTIDTPRITLVSENGSANCFVDDIDINANYVNVSGFTTGCIHIWGDYVNVSNCNVTRYIDLWNANNCTIFNNIITGIEIKGSNNTIENNIVISTPDKGVHWGIDISYSSKSNVVKNNTISNYRIGIWISSHTLGNMIIGNKISDCYEGITIYTYRTRDTKVTDNVMINCGLLLTGSGSLEEVTSHIIANNTVNGKPLYYYVNASNLEVPTDAGQIILVNCTNITIKNLALSNTTTGVETFYSSNITIYNCTITDCYDGIYIAESKNIRVKDNRMVNCGVIIFGDHDEFIHEITNNTVNGKPLIYWLNESDKKVPENAGQIILVYCKNILVENQNISDTVVGIEVAHSSNIIIRNCNVSNNSRMGLYLWELKNSIIENNTCSNNEWGIFLVHHSENNTIKNNDCFGNYYAGIDVHDSDKNIVMNNDVSNSKDMAGISVAHSEYNLIKNNICSKSSRGLDLCNARNNLVIGNVFADNRWNGIDIYRNSENNTITQNIITNNDVGIRIEYSNDNTIYLNDFINNNRNVELWNSDNNHWNSTIPLKYTYNGKTFTKYLGNYWDNYNGTDTNGDGIGETPYTIEQYDVNYTLDYYPLIEPFKNYITVTHTPPPIDGKQPNDLNGDGKYEDVDGDGNFNFGDIVFFFKNFEKDAIKNYPQFYDFNNDGSVNFGDIVALFKML